MYLKDQDFISVFLDLKNIYQHIYQSSKNLNKIFVYLSTAKGWLNVPTALGHMLMDLMPSAQRWADNQANPSDFKTPYSGYCFHVPWSRLWSHRLRRGDLWYKMLYTVYCFCLHDNIRPRTRTSLVFFGALKLFFLYFFFVFVVTIPYKHLHVNIWGIFKITDHQPNTGLM